MFKKIIFNLIIVIILIMIGAAIIRANKAKPVAPRTTSSSIEKPKSNLTPKEAKYYTFIEE